jgi:hypothetical protein
MISATAETPVVSQCFDDRKRTFDEEFEPEELDVPARAGTTITTTTTTTTTTTVTTVG